MLIDSNLCELLLQITFLRPENKLYRSLILSIYKYCFNLSDFNKWRKSKKTNNVIFLDNNPSEVPSASLKRMKLAYFCNLYSRNIIIRIRQVSWTIFALIKHKERKRSQIKGFNFKKRIILIKTKTQRSLLILKR